MSHTSQRPFWPSMPAPLVRHHERGSPLPAPRRLVAAWLLALLLVPLSLVGCGGGDTPPPPPVEGSATVDAAGGFVTGPDGVRLGIPAGSVDGATTFRIARDGSGAPPLPAGIELASAVYAITPHGQAFTESASVELPVTASLAAGRPTFLMKASPGGSWSVIGSGDAGSSNLRAGIESLSYLAVGVCQNNLPAGSLFAQACPSSHRLGLELLINGTTPVPISQDPTYGAPDPGDPGHHARNADLPHDLDTAARHQPGGHAGHRQRLRRQPPATQRRLHLFHHRTARARRQRKHLFPHLHGGRGPHTHQRRFRAEWCGAPHFCPGHLHHQRPGPRGRGPRRLGV